MGNTDRRVIYLIAAARSGSTVMARVLNAHSMLYAHPEAHLLEPLYYLGYYGSPPAFGPGTRGPGLAQRAIRDHVAHLPDGEHDYLRALRAYLDVIHAGLLATAGKQVFVDKTPRNLFYIDFIKKLYPETRLIVLTRHPLAVAVSFLEHARKTGTPEDVLEDQVLSLLTAAVQHIAACLRDRPLPLVHVRYDELVANPEAELARITSFLGLPFEPAMLRYAADHSSPGWDGSAERAEARGSGNAERLPGLVTERKDRWMTAAASQPAVHAFVRTVRRALSDRDIETWGFDPEQIDAQLAQVDTHRAAP
jgi:hypothetical protein